ncbi:hypothetical protein AB6D70_19745 [Vibrio splendidus]
MLLIILFEMSQRDGSYLQTTPIKKSNDEEKELADKCKKAEREFHHESSQRFNSKAFKELNKVKNNELSK